MLLRCAANASRLDSSNAPNGSSISATLHAHARMRRNHAEALSWNAPPPKSSAAPLTLLSTSSSLFTILGPRASPQRPHTFTFRDVPNGAPHLSHASANPSP